MRLLTKSINRWKTLLVQDWLTRLTDSTFVRGTTLSGITEIYIAKLGQRLEDGALQTTSDILNRDQAERDAQEMCQRDPTIDKIAYYSVRDDGNNRHLFTYTNPSGSRRDRPKPPGGKDDTPPGIRLRQPVTPSLWRRILALFG